MTDVESTRRERYGAELAGAGYPGQRVSLIHLLDRVLAGGVVVTGEISG